MRRLLITFLISIIATFALYGQGRNFLEKRIIDREMNFNMFAPDSAGVVKKSPAGGALRSAILPGLGQIYNGSYWKVPLIYGIGAYLVYEYSRFNKKFNDYSDLAENYKNSIYANTYKNYREFYRDYRDSFVWYFALLYLLNVLDAYIDAHLYDFNVNNDFQLRLDPQTGGYQFRFSFNF